MIKYMKLYLVLTALLISVLISACSGTDRSNINTDDPEKAFKIAYDSYLKKDYLQAIDDFTVIKVKFSGSSISDKSQYYLGMSYLNREEFVLAAYEFEYLLKNYATSSFAVDGRFQLAMCYFGLSPRYALDQTYTYQAISEFKNFLELYPTDKNAPECEAKIRELRNKLAFKDLKAAELYYKMDDYKSSIVYYDHILSEYFDTDYADDALYGKIVSLMAKKKYDDVKKEIERFQSRFPKSDLLVKVERIKKSL